MLAMANSYLLRVDGEISEVSRISRDYVALDVSLLALLQRSGEHVQYLTSGNGRHVGHLRIHDGLLHLLYHVDVDETLPLLDQRLRVCDFA